MISIKKRLQDKGILPTEEISVQPKNILPKSKKKIKDKGSEYGVGGYGKQTTTK